MAYGLVAGVVFTMGALIMIVIKIKGRCSMMTRGNNREQSIRQLSDKNKMDERENTY